MLISMVCRKLTRGKGIAEIAEDLDEDESRITVICDAAAPFAPDYDINAIQKALRQSAVSVG